MTKRPNSYDEKVKDFFTSRTARTVFGSVTAMIITFACVIICGIAALVGVFVIYLSGYP